MHFIVIDAETQLIWGNDPEPVPLGPSSPLSIFRSWLLPRLLEADPGLQDEVWEPLPPEAPSLLLSLGPFCK